MWDCVDNYQDITELVPSWKIREWEVSNYITSRNTIQDNGLAVYNAGNEIRFLPPDQNFPNDGFWAQHGSYVHAYIEGCQPIPPNSKSFSTNNWSQKGLLEKANKKAKTEVTINEYPNPCNGLFHIELKGETINLDCSLQITNSMGSTIYSDHFSNQSLLNIDNSRYPKGVYFIKLINGGKSYTYKVVYV